MIFKSCLKQIAALLLVALSVITMIGASNGETPPPLPLRVPDTAWRPLEQRWDPGLQAKLDQALREDQLWQSLMDRGKMAVGLVDLADPAWPRFARVNGEAMMYAASLPKLAILLAACQGLEDGSLAETPQIPPISSK
jgi:beta-lactamase class A